MTHLRFLVSILLLALFGFGCAGPSITPIPENEVVRRLPGLQERAATHPDDSFAQAAYGLALHALERDGESREVLQRAYDLDPAGFPVAMVLADLYRTMGDREQAHSIYAQIDPVTPIQKRLLHSARRRIAQESLAEEMVRLAESSSPTSPTSPTSAIISANHRLAVAPFRAGSANDEPELSAFVCALTELLRLSIVQTGSVDQSDGESYDILLQELIRDENSASGRETLPELSPATTLRGVQERLQLLHPAGQRDPFYAGVITGQPGVATTEAIREFQRSAGLTSDGIVGPRTREALEQAVARTYWSAPPAARVGITARAGRLIGARCVLDGRIWSEDRGDSSDPSPTLNIQADLIDVIDDAVVAVLGTERPRNEFYTIPHELMAQLAVKADASLGLSNSSGSPMPATSPETPTSVGLAKYPNVTRSWDSFVAFGRGLELERRGEWATAVDEYERALHFDPAFALAAGRLDGLAAASNEYESLVNRATRAYLGM